MNVLLIEDDPHTRSLFEMVADYYDYSLKIAEDDSSVEAALSAQTPSVIILDIFLPNTNGYKLLGKLRVIEALSACPIVATTAYYTSDTIMDVERQGFDGCLLKPLDPNTIDAYLNQCISTRNSAHDEHGNSNS